MLALFKGFLLSIILTILNIFRCYSGQVTRKVQKVEEVFEEEQGRKEINNRAKTSNLRATIKVCDKVIRGKSSV